jgi:NAD(P)-dependent dehydrogenase (short-subunit alcohol dehydrogenase family)
MSAQLRIESPNAKFTFIECDLASLASVAKAADKFLAEAARLDVLMCNAGVMALNPGLSKDGYEIQFATNHLGHALLTKRLLPLMLRTAEEPNSDVRIINLTSVAYKTTPSNGIDIDTLKTSQAKMGPVFPPRKWVRYGQSKLANLLYAQELARRYPGITSVSVHPGYVRTDLFASTTFFDRIPVYVMGAGQWLSVAEGPYNQTWAATTKKENLENGGYYEPVAKKGKLATKHSTDRELAERLWEWTEAELKDY